MKAKKTRLLKAPATPAPAAQERRTAAERRPQRPRTKAARTPVAEAIALYEQTTRKIAKIVGRLDCGLALRVVRGKSVGAVFPVATTHPLVIGRDAEADIVIADCSISRRHTLLAWVGNRLWAQDLASSNGTVVNDRPVKAAQLYAGDKLKLGETELVIDGVDRDTDGGSAEGGRTAFPADLLHLPAAESQEAIELLRTLVEALGPRLQGIGQALPWEKKSDAGEAQTQANEEAARLRARVAELKAQGTRAFEQQRREIERLWAEIDRGRATIKSLRLQLAEDQSNDREES